MVGKRKGKEGVTRVESGSWNLNSKVSGRDSGLWTVIGLRENTTGMDHDRRTGTVP